MCIIELIKTIVEKNKNNIESALGVESLNVEIIYRDNEFFSNHLGDRVIADGCYVHNAELELFELDEASSKNVIILNLDALAMHVIKNEKEKIGQALAHEFYHSYQHMQIDLSNSGGKINELPTRIKGWEYDISNNKSYMSSFEVDARKYGDDYITIF